MGSQWFQVFVVLELNAKGQFDWVTYGPEGADKLRTPFQPGASAYCWIKAISHDLMESEDLEKHINDPKALSVKVDKSKAGVHRCQVSVRGGHIVTVAAYKDLL